MDVLVEDTVVQGLAVETRAMTCGTYGSSRELVDPLLLRCRGLGVVLAEEVLDQAIVGDKHVGLLQDGGLHLDALGTAVEARPGETLTLQAKVNEDAMDRGVWYSFREESPYATMTVTAGVAILTISKDFDDWAEHIYVIAHGANGVTAEQTIIILKEEYHLLLNNQIEDVYLYADTDMTLTIEDGDGNPVPLSNATIKIYDKDFKETDDFTIDANGKLVPKEGFYLDKTTVYTIEAFFGGSEEFLSYVWLYVTPSPLEVNLNYTPNRIEAGAYIDFEFVARSNYPATKFDGFQIVILDGDAEVVDGNTIYILPTAEKGSCIMVASKWTDEYGRVKEYHYYTLTVGA